MKGFRMADLLGQLIASLACGLASWRRPSLAGRTPGWMLPYFATCLQAYVSPSPSPFQAQRACLLVPQGPSEKETEARYTLRDREERERQRERESNDGFWVDDSVVGTLASGKTAGLPIGPHVDDCPFDWLSGPGDSLLTLARLGRFLSPWHACLHSPILESSPSRSSSRWEK